MANPPAQMNSNTVVGTERTRCQGADRGASTASYHLAAPRVRCRSPVAEAVMEPLRSSQASASTTAVAR